MSASPRNAGQAEGGGYKAENRYGLRVVDEAVVDGVEGEFETVGDA
jgi:hypothetical protein